MTAPILQMLSLPDSPAALAEWLEKQLIGPNLVDLVAQLRAAQSAPVEVVALGAVLGDGLLVVLQEGLVRLTRERLTALVAHPDLLIELQAAVLEKGGPYWDALLATDSELQQIAAQSTAAIASASRTMSPVSMKIADTKGFPRAANRSVATKIRWTRRPWFVSLATAAVLLVVFGLWQSIQGMNSPRPFGWLRPDVVAADVSRAEHLNQLADAGDVWAARPAPTVAALDEQLLELRRGCSALILAEHKQLPAADKAWLIEHCRAWAAKIDSHLAALEAGRPLNEVRDDANATVRKLCEALRQRAKET